MLISQKISIHTQHKTKNTSSDKRSPGSRGPVGVELSTVYESRWFRPRVGPFTIPVGAELFLNDEWLPPGSYLWDGGDVLPADELLFLAEVESGLIDSIGLSSILYQSGDASTWQTTAVWGFERTATTIAIDTALGGGVLFVGETPKYMTWAQWMIVAQINVNCLFVGLRGIAGYSTDQTANATRIRRYLNSVDEELFISDIFNGFDLNGYTFANPPVVPDQDGKLRISAAGSLACAGGWFVEASSTWAEKTPAPQKKTIRTLTGSKTVYADADPTVWKRATVNPTRTNKCTCRKINPVGTSGVVKSGDAAAVLSVVDDSIALAAAGLDKVCTSGKVYKLDNSGGSTDAFAECQGTAGNTNPHTSSAYVRGSGVVGIRKTNIAGAGEFSASLTSTFTRIADAGNAAATVSVCAVRAALGAIAYFILPQLEEGAFRTDPIITAADPLASITRTGTSITKPTAGLFPMTSATEAQNFGIYMRVIPKATGISDLKLFATDVDADNAFSIRIDPARIGVYKRVSGVGQYYYSGAVTHSVGVPMDILFVQTSLGLSFKTRQFTGGTWGAWSTWADATSDPCLSTAQIASTFSLSDGATFLNYPLLSILKLGNRSTLAEYKAIAEAEVNKINA